MFFEQHKALMIDSVIGFNMKSIKPYFLRPETLLYVAIIGTFLLPKPIIPFILIFFGGTYLSFVLVDFIKSHSGLQARFGPVSVAIFFLTFGICSLFVEKKIITLSLSIIISFTVLFVAQIVWAAWDAWVTSKRS